MAPGISLAGGGLAELTHQGCARSPSPPQSRRCIRSRGNPSMNMYRSVPTITYETASRIVALALQEGDDAGVRGVVTVVDPAMQLVAFGRADGATPHSVETSRRKADTAASTRRSSA